MTNNNILKIYKRSDFRAWLTKNHDKEIECYVLVKKGRPNYDIKILPYLDAVEEALCFGWIDTTTKSMDGGILQKFTPRRKTALWSELNKERVRRLEHLGLMTDAGRKMLPEMDADKFKFDDEVKEALVNSGAWDNFIKFPKLYQRIRIYNVCFYRKRDKVAYNKALQNLIEKTKEGKMYGEWNDYGRLLNWDKN